MHIRIRIHCIKNIHKYCICTGVCVFDNTITKLQLQTTFPKPLYIPQFRMYSWGPWLAVENLDVCTACDPWDSNIQLTDHGKRSMETANIPQIPYPRNSAFNVILQRICQAASALKSGETLNPEILRAESEVVFLCSQHVPFNFPMGSHQVPNMLPRFPMCSPSVFSIHLVQHFPIQHFLFF
jgi:hypothetical protein